MNSLTAKAALIGPMIAECIAAAYDQAKRASDYNAASLCISHEALRLEYERLRDATAAKLLAVMEVAERLDANGMHAASQELFAILRA